MSAAGETPPSAFAGRPIGPLVTREAAVDFEPVDAFGRALEAAGDLVWLDSAIGDPDRGRRSTLCLELEPAVEVDRSGVATLSFPGGRPALRLPGTEVWSASDALLAAESATAAAGLGWCGYVAYEAAGLADPGLPEPGGPDPIADADFAVLRFDRVRVALVSDASGRRLVATGRDAAEAEQRIARWIAALDESTAVPAPAPLQPLEPPDGAPYRDAVERTLGEIAAGRVYQACTTFPIRFARPPSLAPHYLALRRSSPGDFGAYLRLGRLEAASSSPERFFRLDGRRVECRPMKGTRARAAEPERDRELARQLHDSPKDRAENVMIVDLMRNDLGRVCEIGSVEVPTLFQVETYATVHQMTSTIRGTTRAGIGPFGLLQATFPPGSMTGAPKIAACRLLRALESEPRGLYAGSVGWLGYDGVAELSVVIRTLQAWDELARWNVGGGVVWDSTPDEEYREALAKAHALERAGLVVPGSLG